MSKSWYLRLAAALMLVAMAGLTACGGQPAQEPQSSAPTEATPSQEQPPTESTATEQTQTEPPGEQAEEQQPREAPNAALSRTPQMPKGEVTKLQKKDIVVGTGAVAKSGQQVSVDYSGWLTDGTMFDSSLRRNEPLTFQLGAGKVIPGWDQGVAGMKVGGVRMLVIPASLAYGAQGAGGGVIPPNATLVFVVQLRGVE